MLRMLALSSVVLGLAACGGGSNSNNDTPPVSPVLFDQLETVARQDMLDNDAAAVSIAVYQAGEIVFADAYGNKVLNGSEPVTHETLFQLGSTTKMFTGLAVKQLIEQGMFNLNTGLVEALPNINVPAEFSDNWSEITIQQMLTNSTGLLDAYIGVQDDQTLLGYMESIYPNLNPQMNPAGLFFNYSNPNWSYLGAIVEYNTQTPYADWVEQNVFDALGMERSGFGIDTAESDGNYALGVYENGVGQTSLAQTWATAAVIPAGAQTWSTPTDMIQMAKFLIEGNNDVLIDDMRLDTTTPHVSLDLADLPYFYGHGIFINQGFSLNEQWFSETAWEHGGNTDAHSSMFWILPEQEIAVSIMSSGVNDDFSATMFEIFSELGVAPSPSDAPSIEIDTSLFDQHAGTYLVDGMTVHITHENGELALSIPDFDLAGVFYDGSLTPFGESTFLVTVDGAIFDLTFFPEVEGGESVYMRNRSFVGIKQGYGTEQVELLPSSDFSRNPFSKAQLQ